MSFSYMGALVCTAGDPRQSFISQPNFPLTSLRLELPPVKFESAYLNEIILYVCSLTSACVSHSISVHAVMSTVFHSNSFMILTSAVLQIFLIVTVYIRYMYVLYPLSRFFKLGVVHVSIQPFVTNLTFYYGMYHKVHPQS